MIVLLLFIFILIIWLLWLQIVLHSKRPKKVVKKSYKAPEYIPNTFVPIEAHIVPTHASQTNKMNNMIGTVNSSQGVGPGILEVVVPSDIYNSKTRPYEHRWPSGSILPDYLH